MAHVGHSFMQAVVTRALQDDDEGIAVDMGLTFAPVGLEDWKGVSAHAYLRPAEEKGADPHVRVTFQAKDDEGETLKEEFQKILDGVKENMEGFPEDITIEISTDEDDGDKVRITISPPSEADGPGMIPEEDETLLEEGIAAKPTFEMEIHTARTFQEIVDNLHGCPATLDGGRKMTASTKLAKAFLDAMADIGEQGLRGMIPNRRQRREAREYMTRMRALGDAFASFSSHSDTRYDTEKLNAAVCDEEESEQQREVIEQVKGALPHMLPQMIGEETVKTAAGLKDYADPLHSIRFAGGLPEDYEVYIEFDNFHLTPVISELLQFDEEPADPDAV